MLFEVVSMLITRSRVSSLPCQIRHGRDSGFDLTLARGLGMLMVRDGYENSQLSHT